MNRVKSGLSAGMLRANIGDNKNHIYYVICGAGTHSENKKAVLKYAVQEWLESNKYSFWEDLKNGIFFVLITN